MGSNFISKGGADKYVGAGEFDPFPPITENHARMCAVGLVSAGRYHRKIISLCIVFVFSAFGMLDEARPMVEFLRDYAVIVGSSEKR
jgi:hypothetical protein